MTSNTPDGPAPAGANTPPANMHIEVRDLTMKYGSFVVMRGINFTVRRGQVMVIMGGSGCGKSTLLRHMVGLLQPSEGCGDVLYSGKSFTRATDSDRRRMLRNFGVLYQDGALWSGLTLEENVALPLREYTALKAPEVKEVAHLKLALVGLKGSEHLYPGEISGGMRKRAGLARALSLDPEILFFDEPSAGLDPISAQRLDELITKISRGMGTTAVVVTHELESIFQIADTSIFLDAGSRTMLAQGDPREMRDHPPHPEIGRFLSRNKEAGEVRR